MFKGMKLFTDSYHISSDSLYDIQDIEKMRETFNQAFEDNNIDIFVDDDYAVIYGDPYDDLSASELNADPFLNKYFFFPIAKLYWHDGSNKRDMGIRMCFVKEGKHGIKCHVFDIASKQYEKVGSWSKAQEFFGGKLISDNIRKMYSSYISVCNKISGKLEKRPHIVYTTQSGWVEGGRNWFYVPVSPSEECDLLYSKSLNSKYKMNPTRHLTHQEAFQKTWSMLDITDKRITLPLLSYTFLSLITSLMNYSSDEFPKFMICLSGNNKSLDRQGFANLFCNLYDRKMNIFSLNSKYHINSDLDRKMIEKKSAKIRDGILIINTDTRQKLIERSLRSMQDSAVENLQLTLNEKRLDKEFVLNLDISDVEISSVHVEQQRQNPDILSSAIFHATEFFRRIFQNEETFNKKKVEKYLRKRYKHFRKLIEKDDIPQEEDKLHMYSCLLIGFDLLLNPVKNELLVFNHEVYNEEAQAYVNEAVQLFQQECITKNAVSVVEQQPADEKNSEAMKEEHIVFLEKLFELLPVELPSYENKSDSPDINAWMDKKAESIIWINNSVFRMILLSTVNGFQELHEDEQKSAITKYKTSIYNKLRSKEISVILPKNDDPKNSTVKIGTTEKDDYTGNRAAGTRKSCVVFRMDRRKAVEYLSSLKN